MKMNGDWSYRSGGRGSDEEAGRPPIPCCSPVWMVKQTNHPSIVTLKYNYPAPYSSPRIYKSVTPEFLDVVEKSRRRRTVLRENSLLSIESKTYHGSVRDISLGKSIVSLSKDAPSVGRHSSTSTPPIPFSSTDLVNSYPEVKKNNLSNSLRHTSNNTINELDGRRVRDSHIRNEQERDRRKGLREWELDRRPTSRSKVSSHIDLQRDGSLSQHKPEQRNRMERSPEFSDSDRARTPTLVAPSNKSPVPYKNHYFKPNGVRQTGGSAAQYSTPSPPASLPPRPNGAPASNMAMTALSNASKSGEPEDLIAMGTNWGPSQSRVDRGIQSGTAVNTTNTSPGFISVSKRLNSRSLQPPIAGNKQSKSQDMPKYPDPLVGATSSLQQRLTELSILETDTIRWEKARKLRKKPKQDA